MQFTRFDDPQWQNRIRLYQPEEGICAASRAPTDKWNLWHQEHIDPMFTHDRFHWLRLPDSTAKKGRKITAQVVGRDIRMTCRPEPKCCFPTNCPASINPSG